MKTLTYTAAILLLSASTAYATEALKLSTQQKTINQQRAYDYEFNRDEQCQGYYWGVKRLGIKDPCHHDEENVTTSTALNVLSEYVVYFNFDSAGIRPQDEDVLRRAANEISKYNPSEVRVAGYTDTRGSMSYNETLSANRADNVSDFLTDLGVSNLVVDEEALGETNLAVQTGDAVRAQANRRVVIQFIR
jgi:outer membrane protein OmpA-like peptidoglycan-associated protein